MIKLILLCSFLFASLQAGAQSIKYPFVNRIGIGTEVLETVFWKKGFNGRVDISPLKRITVGLSFTRFSFDDTRPAENSYRSDYYQLWPDMPETALPETEQFSGKGYETSVLLRLFTTKQAIKTWNGFYLFGEIGQRKASYDIGITGVYYNAQEEQFQLQATAEAIQKSTFIKYGLGAMFNIYNGLFLDINGGYNTMNQGIETAPGKESTAGSIYYSFVDRYMGMGANSGQFNVGLQYVF